jgi:hypothetical protein
MVGTMPVKTGRDKGTFRVGQTFRFAADTLDSVRAYGVR